MVGGVTAGASGFGSGPGPVAASPYSGFNTELARAPYVTDLTQTSATVNWATVPDIHGSLTYGTAGNCAAKTISVTSGQVTQVRVSPNPTTTYATRDDYQSSVTITGLSPGTAYCYEIFDSASPPVDLLPPTQPFQSFTTLDPASTSSTSTLTFDVVGDFGETTDRGTNSPTSINSNQAAIDSLIGSSGARFVVAVGDIAYNDGGNYNYGDLEETGTSIGSPSLTEISNIFGPNYWPLTGGVPVFAVDGNHGQNSNILTTWPEASTVTSSAGSYVMQQYSSVDGINTQSYPNDWYAFSSGNTRFYILDGSWSDANVGTATGAACPDSAGSINCKTYQVDSDAHFGTSSPEYQWLSNDLQAHPGGIKLAFFHFPLRSDNRTQDSDVYLQNSLEPLLSQNGVNIAFNGHAHDYERNTAAGPGTVMSYVTGGGGAIISMVGNCSSWDAYAIGWSYVNNLGSACGSAPAPSSDAQVYNFLKVTISGNIVTVDPINAAGQSFDKQTYTFATGGAPPVPSAPTNVTAAATSATSVQVKWNPSSEAGGTIASYRITRNSAALTTVAGSTTSFTDSTVQPSTTYVYKVTAVDGTGTVSSAGTSNSVTTPASSPPPTQPPQTAPSTAPSCPTGVTHQAPGEPWAVAAMSADVGGRPCAGYWVVTRSGGVTAIGSAPWLGDMSNQALNAPMIGIAAGPAGDGYYLLGGDGGIFTFGGARFYGSTGGTHLNAPVVAMAVTPSGGGYWLASADGGLFTFGNAPFYGSMGGTRLNRPVVGMSADSLTGGYWLVAADGGIFTFNVPFFGSMGGHALNQPVVGMTPQPDGRGYRMVAGDGGVFDFGDAAYYGSLPGEGVQNPQVTTMAGSVDGNGYYLINSSGNVWAFGDAPFLGNA